MTAPTGVITTPNNGKVIVTPNDDEWVQLNCDTFEIKNFELRPQGYLNAFVTLGIPDRILNYDGRKEVITKPELFNTRSVNSAMGMPITFNHPPSAINANIIHQYHKGTILQQYGQADGTDALIFAATIHDAEMVKGILEGRYKYLSAGYRPLQKVLNADGVYEQVCRIYDHLAILSEDYVPRAGADSSMYMNKLVNVDSTYTIMPTKQSDTPVEENKTPEEKTPEENTQSNTDDSGKTPVENSDTSGVVAVPEKEKTEPKPQPKQPEKKPEEKPKNNTDSTVNNDSMELEKLKADMEERVKLLSTWKPVLDENKIDIDYNADSITLKKQILGCYHPETIINQLNNDSVTEGFWLNFITNHDATVKTGDGSVNTINSEYRRFSPVSNNDSKELNYDSALETERDKFIKAMEGVA